MKKLSYILLIIMLGSFFAPNNVHVCGGESVAKTCCDKEKSQPTEKKCYKKLEAEKTTKKDCNGKCNHQNCNISSVQSFVIVPDIFKIKYDFNLASTKRNKFFDLKSDISSGFNFIWIPPAII